MKSTLQIVAMVMGVVMVACGGGDAEPCSMGDCSEEIGDVQQVQETALCCWCDVPPPGCNEEDPGDPTPTTPPAAPTIANETFNSMSGPNLAYYPTGWTSDCTWGNYVYEDFYGEAGSGAVMLVTNGCSVYTTQPSSIGTGAGTYRVIIRYKVTTGLDAPCTTNCARVEAQWLTSTGALITYDWMNVISTAGAWSTAYFTTTKPSAAVGFRPLLVKTSTADNDVVIDRIAIELVP